MIPKFSYLSITKRDADCYDVYDGDRRVAALRSEFTEDEKYERTAIPGTWRIRWEHRNAEDKFDIDFPAEIANLRFNSVYEAFGFYCGQVLL